MDHLHLNALAFPVVRGELSCARDAETEYRWGVEIHCQASTQFEDPGRPDDADEQPEDWTAGFEPYLYAQMLPLRATVPEELVGRSYVFPQSPDDDPPDWPGGLGWPFFCLYLAEHELAHPMRLTFTQRQGRRYRVEIVGRCSDGTAEYDLRVEAWLDWIGPDPTTQAPPS